MSEGSQQTPALSLGIRLLLLTLSFVMTRYLSYIPIAVMRHHDPKQLIKAVAYSGLSVSEG